MKNGIKSMIFACIVILELWIFVWAGAILNVNLDDNVRFWYEVPFIITAVFFIFISVLSSFMHLVKWMEE